MRSAGLVEKIEDEGPAAPSRTRAAVKPRATARVYFSERAVVAAVYTREDLRAGARLQSPCVVTEYSSTTLVPAGARARVDPRGNLIIELSGGSAE